jgi:hypothetical protein
MKLLSVTAPLLIVSLTGVAVSGMGLMAVRAAAVSTHANLDLLRMNLRVARLHEQLLRHSRDGLAAQLRSLSPSGAAPAGGGGAGSFAGSGAGFGDLDAAAGFGGFEAAAGETRPAEVPAPPETRPVRPWPEAAAERRAGDGRRTNF